jgi:4-hydroxybenzoate polyprenyltransferase
MLKYLRLARFKNLLIIAATMVLVRYMIIQTILVGYGLDLQMPLWNFIALVFATMLIAAGGYVINDYFDTKADLINHPDTVVVGKQITRRGAIAFHLVHSLLGLILGTFVSFRIVRPVFSLLFF